MPESHFTSAESLLCFISDHAEQIYREGDERTEHMPMAFVLMPDRPLTVMGLAVPPDDFRPVFEGLARMGATMIGFICEGWASQARNRTDFAKLKARIAQAGGVANLPPDDRTETLSIEVVTPLERIGVSRPIVRGGGKTTLGESLTYGGSNRGRNRFLSDLPWVVQ